METAKGEKNAKNFKVDEISRKLAHFLWENRDNPYLPFALASALGVMLRGVPPKMYDYVLEIVDDIAKSSTLNFSDHTYDA